jgi:RNA polymerase sigma factor (sigma-70 family)
VRRNVAGAGGQYVAVEDPEKRFADLFDSHYEEVYRYVARRVPAEGVQDVVAETFLVLWRRLDEVGDEPVPWLLGVARRLAANQLRGGARRAALVNLLQVQCAPSSDMLDDGDTALRQALSELSERDREVLALVAWEGLDHKQAAVVMGCTTTAFTVRAHRARRRLARALERQKVHTMQIGQEARLLP